MRCWWQFSTNPKNPTALAVGVVSPTDIRRIAETAGWTITNEHSINSPDLQDGKWEIEMTVAGITEIKPMSAYLFIAE